MTILSSLRARIIVACLLFAAVVVLLFAAIALATVEGIEASLVDERLTEVAHWVEPRYVGGLPFEMPAGLSFHHDVDIPKALRGLPDGIKMIASGETRMRVYTGHDATGNFVVIDHSRAYDTIESTVCSMLAAGFACFLVAALLFGAFVGTGVVRRVKRLGQAVQARRDDPALLLEKDELGVLARAFSNRTTELTGVLERERFFTGDVSHALRLPLTTIADATQVLMAHTASAPLLHRTAARIERAVQEASETVAVLVRLAWQAEPPTGAPLSIAELVAGQCRRYQPLTATGTLTLVYDGGHDFAVQAPRELLVALVGSLVRHACLRTPAGEVRIGLSGHTVVIDDTGARLPAAAVARLSGIAIPEHERGSAGTGLGLALAQRICAYLHAELAYSEREGGGNRFAIRFAATNKLTNF